MKPSMQTKPCKGPAEKKPFRMAELMKEGPRILRDSEIRGAFSAFSSASSEERLSRFMAARAVVRDLGGSADILLGERGGLKLRVRMEFPTSDRTIDPGLHAMAAGMGFELSLESRLAGRGMERRYMVSERRGDLEHAHVRAEDLVRLESLLDSQVRGPPMAEVVEFPARSGAVPRVRADDADRMVALRETR